MSEYEGKEDLLREARSRIDGVDDFLERIKQKKDNGEELDDHEEVLLGAYEKGREVYFQARDASKRFLESGYPAQRNPLTGTFSVDTKIASFCLLDGDRKTEDDREYLLRDIENDVAFKG